MFLHIDRSKVIGSRTYVSADFFYNDRSNSVLEFEFLKQNAVAIIVKFIWIGFLIAFVFTIFWLLYPPGLLSILISEMRHF